MLDFPIVVLGRGANLATLTNKDGNTILPVFTDPAAAQAYLEYYGRLLRGSVIQFSVGGAGVDSPDLDRSVSLLVMNREQANDVFALIGAVDCGIYVAVDPVAGSSSDVLCMELDEFSGLISSSSPNGSQSSPGSSQ
jgi:hypothetical protein